MGSRVTHAINPCVSVSVLNIQHVQSLDTDQSVLGPEANLQYLTTTLANMFWAVILSSVWQMVTVLGPGSSHICWLLSHLQDPLDKLEVTSQWKLLVSGIHPLIDPSLTTEGDMLLTLHWLFGMDVKKSIGFYQIKGCVSPHLAYTGLLPPT